MEGVEKIIAKYNTKLQLVPFSNSQAILVMGKEKQLVSNKDSEVAR
jgi:dipeptidase E